MKRIVVAVLVVVAIVLVATQRTRRPSGEVATNRAMVATAAVVEAGVPRTGAPPSTGTVKVVFRPRPVFTDRIAETNAMPFPPGTVSGTNTNNDVGKE